jgi:hypothetical protein
VTEPAGQPRDARFVRLVLVAGAVLAVGLAVLLFFVGTQVGEGAGSGSGAAATPAATATPTATPTASPSAAPEAPEAGDAAAEPAPGPRAPGVHEWDQLGGGECLTGFTSPWSEQFTVVDCGTGEHTAQLVTRGLFTDPADPASAAVPYPGEAELASRLNLLCTAPAVLDYAAAGGLPDVQWQASFPATDAEWAAGDRAYSCFFSRTSGEPLGVSLVPPAG